MNKRIKNTIFVLLINVVIAAIFVNGQNFSQPLSNRQYVIIGFIILALVAVIPILTYISTFLNQCVDNVRLGICQKVNWIRKNPGKVLKAIGLYIAAAIISVLITYFYSAFNSRSFICPLFGVSLALLSGLISVYLCRNVTVEKPEVLFFSLILTAGIYFINVIPAEVGISWDDQIHYERTINIADFPSETCYKVDVEIIDKAIEVGHEQFGYSEKDRMERKEYLNQLWSDQVTVPYVNTGMGSFTAVSYIPFAFGLTMGRGFHLPYTMIFRLAKMTNLLTYAVVIYYAIKRLKFGKILLGTFALVPTMTFLASNYSYDPCVIGGMLLGFSIFFSYLQQPESKMKNSDIALICISFLLACMPKAVYCVIMLPLLFMPVNRFTSKKQHSIYILSGCITVGILGATFILPRLIQGMGVGDIRGGEGVNAAEQFAYILNNPGNFIHVLWEFLTTYYCLPIRVFDIIDNYAYLGTDYFNYLVPILLFITALLDRNGERGKTFTVGIITIIGILLGIIIVAFTFYLSFTPVGHFTILGCQPRYLLPMVFPFLYVIGIDWFRNPIPKKVFNVLPMLWMFVSFIIYTGIFIISVY